MYFALLSTIWNEFPLPFFPGCGQNVASERFRAVPSNGCTCRARFYWRRKSPGLPRDSKETHAVSARPRRTIHVAPPLACSVLLDVIGAITAVPFWLRT